MIMLRSFLEQSERCLIRDKRMRVGRVKYVRESHAKPAASAMRFLAVARARARRNGERAAGASAKEKQRQDGRRVEGEGTG